MNENRQKLNFEEFYDINSKQMTFSPERGLLKTTLKSFLSVPGTFLQAIFYNVLSLNFWS